jgi:hypothetical protein
MRILPLEIILEHDLTEDQMLAYKDEHNPKQTTPDFFHLLRKFFLRACRLYDKIGAGAKPVELSERVSSHGLTPPR